MIYAAFERRKKTISAESNQGRNPGAATRLTERSTSNVQRRNSRLGRLGIWGLTFVTDGIGVLARGSLRSLSLGCFFPPQSALGRGPHCILRMRNLMVPPAFDRRAGSYFKVERWTLDVHFCFGCGQWAALGLCVSAFLLCFPSPGLDIFPAKAYFTL